MGSGQEQNVLLLLQISWHGGIHADFSRCLGKQQRNGHFFSEKNLGESSVDWTCETALPVGFFSVSR